MNVVFFCDHLFYLHYVTLQIHVIFTHRVYICFSAFMLIPVFFFGRFLRMPTKKFGWAIGEG